MTDIHNKPIIKNQETVPMLSIQGYVEEEQVWVILCEADSLTYMIFLNTVIEKFSYPYIRVVRRDNPKQVWEFIKKSEIK